MTDWLLRLARWIAGRGRTEWADAMAAEADAAGAQSKSWALGCVRASLHDRVISERKFLLAILVIPIAALVFSLILFFGVAWLSRNVGLPAFAFTAILAVSPLPFAYYLGTLGSRRAALLGAMGCCLLYQGLPMIYFWIQFASRPSSGSTGTTVLNVASARLHTCLAVWADRAGWDAPSRASGPLSLSPTASCKCPLLYRRRATDAGLQQVTHIIR